MSLFSRFEYFVACARNVHVQMHTLVAYVHTYILACIATGMMVYSNEENSHRNGWKVKIELIRFKSGSSCSCNATINRRDHRNIRGTSDAHNPCRNNQHRNLTLARPFATAAARDDEVFGLSITDCDLGRGH